MRPNFISKILIIFIWLNSLAISDIIPSNSLKNYTLNRWVVVKDDNLSESKIKDLLKNPISYLKNSLKVENIDLGNQREVAIQAYQLFDNFTYDSKVIAITNIEVGKGQEIGIQYLDYDMESEIYVNGELVMSGKRGYDFQFSTELKKGQNTITIIADLTNERRPSFIMWVFGSQRAEITGTVRNKNGEPVPYADLFLLSKYLTNPYKNADKDGKYKYWLYPNYGEYTIASRNGDFYGYSKSFNTKEYGRYKIDIYLKNKSNVSGTIYTMDKKTPHPGVSIELVNNLNDEVFLTTTSGERGKYRFEPPNGEYKAKIFANY